MNNWLYFSTQRGYTHWSKCACCAKELKNKSLITIPHAPPSSQITLLSSVWIEILGLRLMLCDESRIQGYLVCSGIEGNDWFCPEWVGVQRERLERLHREGVGSGWGGRNSSSGGRNQKQIHRGENVCAVGHWRSSCVGVTKVQVWARPNCEARSAKIRTFTLSYGHKSPWRSLGRAGWYFIKKILVLIHSDRDPIDLCINITLENYSNSRYSLYTGILTGKALKNNMLLNFQMPWNSYRNSD